MPRTLKNSLRAIERAFVELERHFEHLAGRIGQTARQAVREAKPASPRRRTIRITPKRRAQLKLQGVYMTYMRQLGPRDKAQVRAVKDKSGMVAAMRMAKKLVK